MLMEQETYLEPMIQEPVLMTKIYSLLDRNGVELKTFKSMTEASKEIHTDISSISHVCKGHKKYKTAGGYRWKFANKENK